MKPRFCFKILLAALAFSFSAPVHADSELLHVRVIYGEKISDFQLTSEKDGALLAFQSNDGTHSSRALRSEEAQYLLEKVRQIPENAEPIENCVRKNAVADFQTSSGTRKTAAICLGGVTPADRGVTDLVNLLSTLL